MEPERAYWERRLADSGGLGAVGWLGLGEPFNAWMYRVRRRLFLRRLRPLVENRALDVLDVGSGTGFYVGLWKELGARTIVGSDITETAVERLRQRFPEHEFRRLDIGGEEIPDERFDAISAMDMLFHITDDAAYERAFGNLARLLKPGGLLVFTENFVHGPERSGPHQVSRSLDQIVAVIARSGLRPVSRRPVFVLMNGPVDSDSRLLRQGWRVLGPLLYRWPRAGGPIGALMAAVEVPLASIMREGPSTEMMIGRKPG
jgi:SAM-dependent methyltransferase